MESQAARGVEKQVRRVESQATGVENQVTIGGPGHQELRQKNHLLFHKNNNIVERGRERRERTNIAQGGFCCQLKHLGNLNVFLP